MPSLTCFTIRFTPSWMNVFLSVLVISFFLRLGFWQIQRAEQKAQMIKAQNVLVGKKPLQWNSAIHFPQQYQLLTIKGQYLDYLFLFDNQHQEHIFGFNVLTPLAINADEVVLIDRGWVQGDVSRRTFPVLLIPKQKLIVNGSAYYPNGQQWLLGPSIEKKTDKLYIVEDLDTKKVSQILQKKVYPFIIRLDKEDSYGFVRHWPVVSMRPERHLAYAWQWFAMALVVCIIFIALNLKKNEKKDQ